MAIALGVRSARGSYTDRPQSPGDEPRLLVSHFVIRYRRLRDDLPPISSLNQVLIRLHTVAGGYTAGEPDGPGLYVEVNDRDIRGKRFSVNAIKAIQDAIRDYLVKEGLIAVFVYAGNPNSSTPDSPEALDYGAMADNTTPVEVPIVVVVGIVKNVTAQTAPGWRETILPTQTLVANQVKDHSPIQPNQPIYKNDLQDYLSRVNRLPGRHVESSISSANTASDDEVNLNYLVTQPKPWQVYFQAANTGSKDTSVWQERFGAIDNNLFGIDDSLAVDFTTASFTNTDALTASYDVPIFDMTRTGQGFMEASIASPLPTSARRMRTSSATAPNSAAKAF